MRKPDKFISNLFNMGFLDLIVHNFPLLIHCRRTDWPRVKTFHEFVKLEFVNTPRKMCMYVVRGFPN